MRFHDIIAAIALESLSFPPAPIFLTLGHMRKTTPPVRAPSRNRSHAHAVRARIIATAMRYFAEHGYDNARVGDVATELKIAKGSIFQHFGNKETLFLEVYMSATRSFSTYLAVPDEVRAAGFFGVLRHWLLRTEHMVREDWIPYRIQLLGNYSTDLRVRRQINRFLITEDPFGRVAFVRFGLERGELRAELDVAIILSFIDWVVERFQDALLVEELDPGLFRHHASVEKNEARIDQILAVLRRAIGSAVAPDADVPQSQGSR